jgi:hypothetical protein
MAIRSGGAKLPLLTETRSRDVVESYGNPVKITISKGKIAIDRDSRLAFTPRGKQAWVVKHGTAWFSGEFFGIGGRFAGVLSHSYRSSAPAFTVSTIGRVDTIRSYGDDVAVWALGESSRRVGLRPGEQLTSAPGDASAPRRSSRRRRTPSGSKRAQARAVMEVEAAAGREHARLPAVRPMRNAGARYLHPRSREKGRARPPRPATMRFIRWQAQPPSRGRWSWPLPPRGPRAHRASDAICTRSCSPSPGTESTITPSCPACRSTRADKRAACGGSWFDAWSGGQTPGHVLSSHGDKALRASRGPGVRPRGMSFGGQTRGTST